MFLMSPGSTLVCFLTVLVTLCWGLDFEKSGFDFVQEEYARAITEYHAVNKSVMHIRATGCGNQPVKYTITEPDTPFVIDNKGHVLLTKSLNSEKAESYVLHVKAVSGNGKCVAHTIVRFEILNKNRHAPRFEFEKYSCDIIENTRELRFNPPLKVVDADHGDAGKVKNVTIVESGLPFVFTVDDDGIVKGRATKDVDAEDITDYFFDIVAWDNGKPPKSSYPVSLECEVDDENEFAPQFLQDNYQATIYRGVTYKNIMQVFAIDEDVGIVNGHICKYIVEGFNLPFTISDTGIISLAFPLGQEAYDLYEFQVDAVDCGGMMSLNSTKVSITVKTPCHAEFVGPAKHELVLQQCTGKVFVVPDVTFNECAEKQEKANFSAIVRLETKAGMGCDRESFEASDSFTVCGASDFIDLLPKPGTGREWTEALNTETKRNGEGEENGYFFDGKMYVEIPDNVVPEDIGDKFTISTWVKMGISKKRQTIIANTDKERLDRVHFSLSTYGTKLLFVHRREAIHASRDLYCNAEFQYKPSIFDSEWHHIVVIADGCAAKLYIDGVHQSPVLATPDWTLHNSNLKNRMSVGARFLAKERIYSEKFTGYLSGLVIKPNNTLNELVLRCVTGCKEHVNVDGPLPGKLFAETIDFRTIRISGVGAPKDFIKALQHLVYINEQMVPTPGKRSVEILSMMNQMPLPTISVDVNVAGNTRPVIVIQGLDSDIGLNWEKRTIVKEKGLRIFDTLEIEYEGCEVEEDSPVDKVRFLDTAVVMVDPPFKKGESFNFPLGIKGLREKGLSVSFNDKELVIRGISHFSEYEDVLRQVFYVNLDPADDLHHKFTVSVSTLKGKCESDKEVRHVNTVYTNRGLEKYEIHAAKSKLNQEQLPGIVSMESGFGTVSSGGLSGGIMALIIICSVSIFALLVVMGIYKYRKRPETVKVVPPGDDKEEMYWDDTGLSGVRITLNPMQKFQELDLNEDAANTDKSDTEDDEGGAAKGLLEWDNSDI